VSQSAKLENCHMEDMWSKIATRRYPPSGETAIVFKTAMRLTLWLLPTGVMPRIAIRHDRGASPLGEAPRSAALLLLSVDPQ